MQEWDVITLMETWVGKKGWDKVRGRLPNGYIWKMQEAKKTNRKGRE